jgi:hypothetical protein
MTILQLISDFGLFLSWFFLGIKTIFVSILAPIGFIFSLLRIIIGAIFLTPPNPALTFTFSQDILDVFNSIPSWSVVSSVLGAIVIFIIGIATFKLLLHS